MSSLFAFFNSFLSYLLLFGVFVVIAIVAVAIGITLRKSKDAKSATAENVGTAETTADTANE